MLVQLGGKTVFEDYPNRGGPNRAHALASGTKSFSGIMALLAQQEGLLDLGEKVADTLGEWKSDPQKSQITLWQLLHLVSGIEGGNIGQTPTYSQAIAAPVAHEPGTRFSYGPVPYQIFGEVMRRKVGDPLAYLKRRLLLPLGLEYAFWRQGDDGNPNLPSGAFLTARQWAKLGNFVREKSLPNLDLCFESSSINPLYGLTWWVNRPITQTQIKNIGPVAQAVDLNPDLVPDLVMAAGAGDQRLYVSRALDLVVVRQGLGVRGTGYSDKAFLGLLLGLGHFKRAAGCYLPYPAPWTPSQLCGLEPCQRTFNANHCFHTLRKYLGRP
jgi:CubicO group peptidase (beta-lactamase class C family)